MINKKRFWTILIILHLLFMGKQLFFGQSVLQDSKEYLYAADNIIHSHALYSGNLNESFNPDLLTKRPFLFPLILVFFKFISFENNFVFLFLILLVQNLISICCIKIAEKTVLSLKGNFSYKAALIILILTPAQLIYANLIMSEIWLQLSIMLMLYCLIFRAASLKNLFLLAVLCMASISLKPVMLFMALCLPVYAILLYRKKINFYVIPISLLPILFVFLTLKWNEQRNGYRQYSSISTINLLHYNTYTLLIHQYGIQKADSIVDNITEKAAMHATYAQKQESIEKESIRIIGGHKARYTYLHIRGIIFCLSDPGRFDITQFFDLPHNQNLVYETSKQNNTYKLMKTFLNPLGFILLLIFLMNIYKIFALIKFTFTKSIPFVHRLTLLFFPCYILMLTGPIGSSRFAMPFFPIILIITLAVISIQKSKKIIR